MANQLTCLDNAAEAACAKLKGWPAGPATYSGDGSPEAAWIGYWLGDTYMDTSNGNLWTFNGTPGENTGWVDQ